MAPPHLESHKTEKVRDVYYSACPSNVQVESAIYHGCVNKSPGSFPDWGRAVRLGKEDGALINIYLPLPTYFAVLVLYSYTNENYCLDDQYRCLCVVVPSLLTEIKTT